MRGVETTTTRTVAMSQLDITKDLVVGKIKKIAFDISFIFNNG